MTANDCLTLIYNKIKELKRVRMKKQTEIECLGEEINNLEDLAFKIEKEIDNDEK